MKRVIWKRFCAAVQGRSHATDKTPCQDNAATAYRRNVSVVTLSDGAGSARLSHFGSAICSRTLCSILCRHFDEIRHLDNTDVRAKIIKTLQEGISAKAHELNASSSDFAATALAVAVKRNRYIVVHLGDGVIGAELTYPDGTRRMKTLSSPDNGEHTNETFFITSGNAAEHLKMVAGTLNENHPSRITGFILMSDGPEAALYRKTGNQLAPACLTLLESTVTLRKSILQRRLRATLELIAQNKTHDDCSLALMKYV